MLARIFGGFNGSLIFFDFCSLFGLAFTPSVCTYFFGTGARAAPGSPYNPLLFSASLALFPSIVEQNFRGPITLICPRHLLDRESRGTDFDQLGTS